MIWSNPISAGWVIHKLEKIIPMKFFHHCECSEPHVRFPNLGIQRKNWESPGNLTLKASRIWLQENTTGLGETDSSLEGYKQNLAWTKTQRKEAGTPHKTEPTLPISAGVSPLEIWVSRGSPQGRGKVSLGINPLGGPHKPDHRAYRPEGWVTSAKTLLGLGGTTTSISR